MFGTTFLNCVIGATILLYTFPILLVAALGCVYIHLGKKLNKNIMESTGKNDLLTIWKKKPLLVKGPLGILSVIELAFFMMFIALLVWSFSTYLHIGFAKITPKSLANSGEKMWEAQLESVALRLGLVGNIVLAFLFFPVARGSSILPLFGLTSEGCIKYHIWLGHIVMVLFTAHGISYVTYWIATNEISEMISWEKTGVSNVAGELALVAGLVMWITTIPRIRRKMFELFFYTHYLYILFIFFFILHVGITYSFIMLPGFYLFVVDRYLRFLQSRQNVRLVSARVLPCETLELNFSKAPGLSYTPTSIMFVNVGSISKMQWHPFTICSSSNLEPEKLSVVIKSEGSWSRKLYQMLSSQSLTERLDISVEGPYGPASTHFLRHDSLVMVSGGSGITPFFSIIRELIFTGVTLKCKTPKVTLICAFKNSSELTMLDLLLPLSSASTPSGLSNLDIQIEAYVTQDKAPLTGENKDLIQTLWFKPRVSDAPISSILGSKTWLWLAAIVSTSFVMFLLLLGIMNQYYIYPIDHNTNKIYGSAPRALLSMLLICGSIALTANVAVVLNKKDNVKDAMQIQNIEGSSPPMASPNSWFYNADRELESLPQHSLLQSTKVHFGERPDLKRMLFECKGSSVGALVCGPKKMRHEVANICSSGLADNLHFESISFSW